MFDYETVKKETKNDLKNQEKNIKIIIHLMM